jgi:hypothetical protein
VLAGTSGQTLTYGTASIAVAQDPSTPVAAIVAGNQTRTAAAFKFTTVNDSYTISEISIGLVNNSVVSNIILKDGAATVGTQPGGIATTTFSNLSINVPANSTKILTVDLQLGAVGYGYGTSGDNVKVILDSYKKAPSSTGVISTDSTTWPAGNNLYVYKAIPTITNVTLPTGTLIAGTNTLAKFSLSSGGTGTIAWTHLVFTYSTSASITLASPTLWDADTSTQVTASSTIDETNKLITVDTLAEQQISGAKTYVLKATVGKGAAFATGDYVATYIANPTAHATPISATTASTTTATIVWSDLAAQSHTIFTYDWMNDNLVKNLPTDTQTLTK